MKKRALVVCPGRGSYTKQNLGYLKDPHGQFQNFLDDIDQRREALGEIKITVMDAMKVFKTSLHTKGEHASPLIYACAYKDYLNIDRNEFDIVGICGNSMGWYLSLAFSGALSWQASFDLIQTMGGMMRDQLIGGQIIYPVMNEDWTPSVEKAEQLDAMMQLARAETGESVYISIVLGGYRVIAGESKALQFLLKELPKNGDYPFQLINHGAFHTPLLAEVSKKAFQNISKDSFKTPLQALVDGRGQIFDPLSASLEDLYQYTLNHQVLKTYDFSKSVSVALKEFAPDNIILLGPGNSLGGVIGQILVQEKWLGLKNKGDFQALQKEKPFLISMGI